MIDSGRRSAWPQLGQSLEIRLISRFVRRQPSRLRRRRFLDGRKRYGRLAGVQDDLFRPFAHRLDPDNRSIDDQLFGEHRCGRWQTPVGYQKKNHKRASDDREISGYGHNG
jgi:hypothetical protein